MMTFDLILSTLVGNNGNRLCELLIPLVVIGLELTIASTSMNIVRSEYHSILLKRLLLKS